MAKKKGKIKEREIIDAYMDTVLTHGIQPNSIYSFSKDLNVEESDFYEYFNSFKDIEDQIFKIFFTDTLLLLEKSDEYNGYSAQEKLLSFYYTFFEILSSNRSYVLLAFSNKKNAGEKIKMLAGLRKSFTNYVDDLQLPKMDIGIDKFKEMQKRSMDNAYWAQMLFILKFWLDDSSSKFEKTDLLIEKTLKVSFDLMENDTLKSVVDFGKFYMKEKIPFNW